MSINVLDKKKLFSASHALDISPDSVFARRCDRHRFGFSQPFEQVLQHLQDLLALMESLGNPKLPRRSYETFGIGADEAYFDDLPFSEKWRHWWKESRLDRIDLIILNLHEFSFLAPEFKKIQAENFFCFHTHLGQRNYDNVVCLLSGLDDLYQSHQSTEIDFMIDWLKHFYSFIPADTLKIKGPSWLFTRHLRMLVSWHKSITLEQNKALLQVIEWMILSFSEETHLCYNFTSLHTPQFYCYLYDKQLITQAQFQYLLSSPGSLQYVSKWLKLEEGAFHGEILEEYPWFTQEYLQLQEALLSVELARIDAPTYASAQVQALGQIFGAEYFVRLGSLLMGTELVKGYILWNHFSVISKQNMFCQLITSCSPNQTDTYEQFAALLDKAQWSDEYLVKLAIYAPEWADWIGRYLQNGGVLEAIWWLRTHAKLISKYDTTYLATLEREAAARTTLSLEQLQEGVVDPHWFQRIQDHITPQLWALVKKMAPYITDGKQVQRALWSADVLLGKITFQDIQTQITTKRNRDYVGLLGVLPWQTDSKEQEIRERYQMLQTFLDEGKQGSKSAQQADAFAVHIALQNLSIAAGYPCVEYLIILLKDPEIRALLAEPMELKLQDLQVQIQNDLGQLELVYTYKGKHGKAPPASLKKHVDVLTIQQRYSALESYVQMAHTALEQAMRQKYAFTEAERQFWSEQPMLSTLWQEFSV